MDIYYINNPVPTYDFQIILNSGFQLGAHYIQGDTEQNQYSRAMDNLRLAHNFFTQCLDEMKPFKAYRYLVDHEGEPYGVQIITVRPEHVSAFIVHDMWNDPLAKIEEEN